MPKAQLFVRRKSDRRADLCKVGSRSRLYRNAEIDGIDQHKAVATERRVDPHRTNTGNVEFYVKTIGEGTEGSVWRRARPCRHGTRRERRRVRRGLRS